MQAVQGYTVSVGTKKVVAPRCPISTDHVDFATWPADGTREIGQQIEDARIIVMNIAGAMVT
jgi:hypothetical protein